MGRESPHAKSGNAIARPTAVARAARPSWAHTAQIAKPTPAAASHVMGGIRSAVAPTKSVIPNRLPRMFAV